MLNNDIFKINLKSLEKKNKALSASLEKLDVASFLTDDYRIIPLKEGRFTLQKKMGQDFYYLHSKYDPEKESDELVEKLIKDRYDIIFCGGFGLGYAVRSFFRKKRDSFARLVVIEKDQVLLKIALSLIDLSPFLEDEKFAILTVEKDDIRDLNDILITSVTKKCYTFIPPVYLKLEHDFYSNLKNLIESYLSRKNINIATLTRFQNLWIYNIIRNHKKFLFSAGISEFFGKYTGTPALVISAGPSLNDNLALIRQHQNKFIIIAVDSIYQSLLHHGIHPDFVITVDPQYINFKYFEYNKDKSPALISEIAAFPLTLRSYQGRTFFFSSIFPLAQFIERFTTPKGEIDMGGSVSTTAFDLAVKIGADPIILMGQDLAFLKDRSHSKGSYVEKYWCLRYGKFNTSLNGLYKYINNNLFIKIRSNSNALVATDKRLMIFLVWFQNKMNTEGMEKIRVYNTSLEGARIDRMQVRSFQDILAENDFKDKSDLKLEIRRTESIPDRTDYEGFLSQVQAMKKDLSRLETLSKDSLDTSRHLMRAVRTSSRSKMQGLLNRLDKNDQKLRELSEVTNFLSLLVQDRIYSIMEDYENFLTPKEKKDPDQKTAKRNLILYEGIYNSIKMFQKLFELMK